MEELLRQVVTISSNFPRIEKSAREAVDLLSVQHGLIRDPAHELREKCLLVLQLCLETRRNKFTALAIQGLHKLIRDDRFYSNIEPDDDFKWLPHQFLKATNSFLSFSVDTQIDILKILLIIACSRKWTINGRTTISIICLCSEAFYFGNAEVRAAAQAAASQAICSLIAVLEEEHLEDDSDSTNFISVIPVLQFICSKIDESDCTSSIENGTVFFLECLLTLCSSLPEHASSNVHLRTFLWQKLCPVLISVLGTPKIDKNIVTRQSIIEKEPGRGSRGLSAVPGFNNLHVKTVYCVSAELIRLFGRIASLRPVLESVFHRVLLYPAPEHRLEAIKAVAELVRDANRLIDMTGPMISDKGRFPLSDLSLLRLIMDSVEECINSTLVVMQASIDCCIGLLKAIEHITLGSCVPSEVAHSICLMYPTLTDSDYDGPRLYESAARLPKHYRERIEKETECLTKKNNFSNRDVESDSSADTEGPQEEDFHVEVVVVGSPVKNVQPCICSTDKSCDGPVSFGDHDRQQARHFFRALHDFLPLLSPMRSSIQVDQALQRFASQFSEGLTCDAQGSRQNLVKAEGIYLAVYLALLLDMRLLKLESVESCIKHHVITEDDFVVEAKGLGVLSYLSLVWLRELYQLINASSLLLIHGYLPINRNSQAHALINLLTDVEGLGTCQRESQMLWDYRRLIKPAISHDDGPEREAGLRLARRILTCSWNTILRVLAVPLTEKRFKSSRRDFRGFKFLRKEERSREMKHLVTASIDGLQTLTRLCNDIGLQERCGSILELLASALCVGSNETKSGLIYFQPGGTDRVHLTPSDSLSLELLLGSGLEIGSHCSECWPHVFRCCIYVKKLERVYFSKSENRNLSSTTKIIKKHQLNERNGDNLTFEPPVEEDTCIDVYSFLCSSELSQTVSELVSPAIQQSTDVLKSAETAKVICVLSQLVDILFDDAALKLNLKSLESFSSALCECNRTQLLSMTAANNDLQRVWWHRFNSTAEASTNTLLLDSIGDIMLKSVRSGRPLFHVMRIWEIVVPHLIETACHKDLTVARRAVKHIHDVVNAALAEHTELPHFHTTEIFFKPFETLLCLESCEPDIQDQIVGCLCEFVEANFREIRSGWRSLFGALRAVSTNINTLSDVFRIFLELDNVSVFSYAAVDYILCLLKHLRAQNSLFCDSEFGLEILKYLQSCQRILSSTYKSSRDITFHSAFHIYVSDGLLVDPAIPYFDSYDLDEEVPKDLQIDSNMSSLTSYLSQYACEPALDSFDRHGGVLRVWFLLLEGMHSAAISANTHLQPNLLNMLYEDLSKLIDDPGPMFGLIVFNRIVLPVTQSWVRQLSRIQECDASGLKQSIGLLSDLILHYFVRLHSDHDCENLLNLLLSQVLLMLSECCVHPIPGVARIGPSCVRHIILNIGRYFNAEQWNITTIALYRLCDITLTPLRQLMIPFSKDSEYYYGDSGQVKVAVRRTAPINEVHYSNQLSHRVFLLDEQQENNSFAEAYNDPKTYTFLICKTKDDVIRIPVKTLVTTLQAHHSVLQIVANVLLEDTKHEIPSLAAVLRKSSCCPHKDKAIEEGSRLPGLMSCLKPLPFARLLECLDYSYLSALAFDSRPGLKFLIQKVAGFQQAANLYRQAGVAWSVKLVSLFEYCLHSIRLQGLRVEDVKHLLDVFDPSPNPDLSVFLNKFRTSFDELCSTYLEVILMGQDVTSTAQEKLEEPIHLLMTSRAKEEEENVVKRVLGKSVSQKYLETTKTHKPFFFSDFSKEVNSENGKNEKEYDSKGMGVDGCVLFCEESYGEKPEDNEGDDTEEIKNYNNYKSCSERRRKDEPPVPPEIEQQRRHSFMKDSEALCRVWSQMLASVFQLLQQLGDEDFRKILPIFIDGVRRLVARVSEPSLKVIVSDFFQRISVV